MKQGTKKFLLGVGGLAIIGVAATFVAGSDPIHVGAAFMNIFRAAGSPPPAMHVEFRKAAQFVPAATPTSVATTDDDWPSYNRTPESNRFSSLAQINKDNAGQLKVLCTYDTKKLEGAQTGILMVNGAIIGTTAEDIFSIDANTCKQNWLHHEDSGIGLMPVNRGPAYMDGKLFRAYPDGYVRAFDAATGRKLWESFIGDKNNKHLWYTAATSAWNGMVFQGTAGGDTHGNRGRITALDAQTGKPLWQTFTVPQQPNDAAVAPLGKMPVNEMKATWKNPPDVPITGGGVWTSFTIDPSNGYIYVPVGNPAPDFVKSLRPGTNMMANTMLVLNAKTGDYVKHYSIMPDDWHDWDMSNAPILYTTRGGRRQMTFHPKDGFLYAYNMANDQQLYRQPVTKRLNDTVPFVPDQEVYFCPGSVGGGEWNSAAYDPQYNLIFTGENEWCTKAKIKPDSKAARARDGAVWFGVDYVNPYKLVGALDPPSKWGGWFYATDADTGQWLWRARTNYPIVAAVTPTAGQIVMFGDLGGNFRVMRANDGKELFFHHFEGGIAGGLITYSVGGQQRIALMQGVSHPQWPVAPNTGKIEVLGL